MPSVPANDAQHADRERNPQAVENGGKHVAALFVGAERDGLWPSAVHSGEIREFINCSCAGIERVLHRSCEANSASRKNSSVTAAATMVIRERRNEQKSLSSVRLNQPARTRGAAR